MLLIILALVVVSLIALNCFYNISGLLCYIAGFKGSECDAFVRRCEEMRSLTDADFDV